MKNLILLALALFLIASCNQEEESLDSLVAETVNAGDLSADNRAPNKVTICHLQGNGNYAPIEVNQNAVQAHLGHGDYLPDEDGDGYTLIGACTGSADDCDDTDDTINPGAPELCSGGVDENCDNLVDCDDPDCENSSDCESCDMSGLATVTLPDGSTLYVNDENSQSGVGVVFGFRGLDIQGVPNRSALEALNDFNGANNTSAIYTEAQNEPFFFAPFAAKICEELEARGCDDWYLPSIGELKAMSDELGGTALPQAIYQSSTEQDADNAHLFFVIPSIPDGGYVATQPKNAGSVYKCRCVRKD